MTGPVKPWAGRRHLCNTSPQNLVFLESFRPVFRPPSTLSAESPEMPRAAGLSRGRLVPVAVVRGSEPTARRSRLRGEADPVPGRPRCCGSPASRGAAPGAKPDQHTDPLRQFGCGREAALWSLVVSTGEAASYAEEDNEARLRPAPYGNGDRPGPGHRPPPRRTAK